MSIARDTAASIGVAEQLDDTLSHGFVVNVTDRGWVEVRVRPEYALRDNLDFMRVVVEDAEADAYKLVHLTHNEVIKGEARVSNDLAWLLPTMVREWCEVTF